MEVLFLVYMLNVILYTLLYRMHQYIFTNPLACTSMQLVR
jgi:hypothetical protein